MKFKLWYIIIGLIIVFAVIVLISENARKSTEGQTECSTGSMCITTDKVKYVQGEVIKITIKNNLSQVINFFNIEIEGFIDNKWQTANRDIECGCLEFCTKTVASLWPWEAKQYTWNQEICQNLNFTKFRAKIIAKEYYKEGEILKLRGDLTLFSNEFEIKEIKCSIDSECKDLNCSTEKKPEPQPECVNNTCKCTYSHCKEVGGCA